jgi:IS30 family transposase
MRTYTQLTQELRYKISALKRMGHSRNEIAQVVEMHRSTISRELHRNTSERGYRPKQAHEKAIGRRTNICIFQHPLHFNNENIFKKLAGKEPARNGIPARKSQSCRLFLSASLSSTRKSFPLFMRT